jgi:hypothetical protein
MKLQDNKSHNVRREKHSESQLNRKDTMSGPAAGGTPVGSIKMHLRLRKGEKTLF